jgi:Ca2+-transporting ATPase
MRPPHTAPATPELPSIPHAQPAAEVLAELQVDPARGVDDAEASERRLRFGANELQRIRRPCAWRILAAQFRSLMAALLLASAAASALFGRAAEAAAIAAVIAFNAVLGFATELRAARSMEALRQLGRTRTSVRRAGRSQRIDATLLVPGDVVLLEAGDVVTADLRLLGGSKLQCDESLLTGESAPVTKHPGEVAPGVPLAARSNMLFKGASVTRGAGEAVVVGTGMRTELGRITQLVESARDEATPLERRLAQLGWWLAWLTLAIALLVVAAGLAAGRDLLTIVQTAIALAVAAVPEGLPVIATLALARGMHRMARRNALVNRLAAVETLGATGLIIVDKTGTLTENRMTVSLLALPKGDVAVHGDEFAPPESSYALAREPQRLRALEAGVLCNDAALGAADGHGDPLELALLRAGRNAGIERSALVARAPELREVAFDPAVKMMATFHRAPAGVRVAVKGAPEAVLAVCSRVAGDASDAALDAEARARWLARNEALARRGLRVLALAERDAASIDEEPYSALTLLGLVGIVDPPRSDVRAAIAACRDAGIRVVMATGDQPATARAIARAVGLVERDDAPVVLGSELAPGSAAEARAQGAAILARMSPEQKLGLIALHQRAGAIVAMTGDGVNDAPALRKADIGVAMGARGAAVAREAADIVLRDDAFATIVAAIHQGRVIFGNIRTFVIYLMSCNLSELLVVGVASVVAGPLLMPLQILFLNLVTDVFPALALGAGEGAPDAMRRPPRDPREPILTRAHWRTIAVSSSALTAATLGAFACATRWLGRDEREAATVAFLTLAFAQVWHVFAMRSPASGAIRNEITANSWVWGAVALCTGILIVATHTPEIARALALAPLGARSWALVAAASFAPLALSELRLRVQRAALAGRGGA